MEDVVTTAAGAAPGQDGTTTLVGHSGAASTEAPARATTISPRELATRLERGDPLFVLDVREPVEWRICRLEGATLIPLQQLAERVDEVPRDREIVAYCKSGARSGKAAQLLRQRGFTRVLNLEGGILGWAQQVDPTLPRY